VYLKNIITLVMSQTSSSELRSAARQHLLRANRRILKENKEVRFTCLCHILLILKFNVHLNMF
jgi:hypothetical protein